MILVTGANGYVGVHLIERLCAEGEVVRALVRRGCSGDEKAYLGRLGATIVEADFEEREALAQALEGVRTVVHLLGSIERPRHGGYEEMHARKTKLLVTAYRRVWDASPASKNGRIVYLSALGASPEAKNLYSKTKGEAEEEIAHSGFEWVIVRSSLIFGRETGQRDSKLVRKLARMAVSRRVIPLVRGGQNRVQPIYVGDCVSCICEAIRAPGDVHEVWEVGGPEPLSLREIATTLLRVSGISRGIIGIPYPLAYCLGAAAKVLHREGLINLEQVRLTRHDSLCSCNKATGIVQGRLVSFEEGMRRTAVRFGSAAFSGGVSL
ncbi:MAG: NAD(P)H-binding protein [Candidatus Aureabacteria bacterium]|nr:NAD(P)H-binding protein [Candidatus Auribacterota bacterium]